MKVVTEYVNPPIPVRSHDWVAYFPDMEEDGPRGHGSTEVEALKALAEQIGDALAEMYERLRVIREWL